MNVSRSINIGLAKKDMSRIDLAKALNVTPQNVYHMLGRDEFTTVTLKKLASVFGMPVSEFIALGEE